MRSKETTRRADRRNVQETLGRLVHWLKNSASHLQISYHVFCVIFGLLVIVDWQFVQSYPAVVFYLMCRSRHPRWNYLCSLGS